jgi:hypothetical protein
MHWLCGKAAAEAGRLLRILLLRLGSLSTDAGRKCHWLLHNMTTVQTSRDWVARTSTSLVAWWIPHAALFAGLFAPVPIRALVWAVALIWMGAACIANSRRWGRTHCRYTGPFYLAMIVPVLVVSVISSGIYEWIAIGVVIAGGSRLIWWATERAWGKFS